MSAIMPGEYFVAVERDGELVHEFRGYADNPSEALEKALNARQETVWADGRGEEGAAG